MTARDNLAASDRQIIRRNRRLPERPSAPVARRAWAWQNAVLALACVGAIVAAFELVGPAGSSTTSETRLATVERGVVQSTVSASGNLAPISESDLNFKTSGILTGLYVAAGQHVSKGQLLAQIDSTSASVALQEAEANLEAAQAKLAATEANPSAGSSTGIASAAAYTGASGASGATGSSGDSGATGATTPVAKRRGAGSKKKAASAEPSAVTQATDAANIASAEAAVASGQLTVKTDEEALAGTKLYAPSAGTVASISGAVGDEVTAGSGGSSSAGDDSSGSGSGGSGGLASALASAVGSSSTSSSASDSSSSSSAFIVLANLSAMQLVVSVSESDIGTVKTGQPATISVDALPNEEFAAKVTAISLLSSDSSGVVSYDVTIRLTQNSRSLRPGMTATATIVTAQANNAVNVESAAVSSRGTGSTVTLDRDGKMTVTPVITGLVGATTTQIVAGLRPGEEVAIPISTSIATSSASSGTGSGTLGGSGTGSFSGLGGGGGGFRRLFGGGG
jgi:multidrug efflux pump subunit AcrA (membrane-fusion protein)